MAEKRFITGEVMLREGDPGNVAYLIKEGRVSITKNSPQGIIRLTTMGKGQMLGEISLIDGRPRIATAVALEPVTVRVIHKEQFDQMLKSDPALAIRLLRVLADRLRDAHDTILSIQSGQSTGAPSSSAPKLDVTTLPQRQPLPEQVICTRLRGLSDAAVNSLDGEVLEIDEYPYLIGRDTRSSSADNDLWIPDMPPYQISRNHLAIILDRNEVLITDRGSHLGFAVDGERYGQEDDEEQTAEIRPGVHELLIGGEDSPYRYEITVDVVGGN